MAASRSAMGVPPTGDERILLTSSTESGCGSVLGTRGRTTPAAASSAASPSTTRNRCRERTAAVARATDEVRYDFPSPYLDDDFVRTVFRAPKSARVNGDVRLRLISEGSPALGRIRSDRGVGGDTGRFFKAASRSLLEFTFKAEHAYDYGMPQWLARVDHLFSPFHLERAFLGRHKPLHFRVWYRNALSEYLREMLLDSRALSRPYLERTGLEAVVRGHLKGDRNYTTEIHKVLTLELVHRLFLESK